MLKESPCQQKSRASSHPFSLKAEKRMEASCKEEGLLQSPRNRVKFLCSHGGKILPRPSDGQLKYVGGDTRIVSVPATITFSELMSKLNDMFIDSDVVLKYQLLPEDLDALISVTCDEDLRNMFDESNLREAVRLRDVRRARMRAFLLPSNPPIKDAIDTHIPTMERDPDEHLRQRYIEAINSITRTNSDLSSSSHSSENTPNGVGETCDQELWRVNSSPNLLRCLQPRPRRPGTLLMASRSDVGRYSADHHLARRFHAPVDFHRRESGRFRQMNGNSKRSIGLGNGGELSPVTRWGSPLGKSSNRQEY